MRQNDVARLAGERTIRTPETQTTSGTDPDRTRPAEGGAFFGGLGSSQHYTVSSDRGQNGAIRCGLVRTAAPFLNTSGLGGVVGPSRTRDRSQRTSGINRYSTYAQPDELDGTQVQVKDII